MIINDFFHLPHNLEDLDDTFLMGENKRFWKTSAINILKKHIYIYNFLAHLKIPLCMYFNPASDEPDNIDKVVIFFVRLHGGIRPFVLFLTKNSASISLDNDIVYTSNQTIDLLATLTPVIFSNRRKAFLPETLPYIYDSDHPATKRCDPFPVFPFNEYEEDNG